MVVKKCTICDRNFKKTEHYKRHERSHTNERPYECSVCHKKFSRRDVLTRHAKGHVQDQNSTSGRGSNVVSAATPAVAPATPELHSNTLAQVPAGATEAHQNQLPGLYQTISNRNNGAQVPFIASDVNPEVLDEQPPSYFDWGDVTTGGATEFQHSMTLDPMPNDVLQTWLVPRADSLSHYSSTSDLFHTTLNSTRESDISLDIHSSSPTTSSKAGGEIPNERFARVERCWLVPTACVGRLMDSLWKHVSCYNADNIFSLATYHPTKSPTHNSSGSRFDLDEECRLQLQRLFSSSSTFQTNFDSNNISHPLLSTSGTGSIPTFPPAEVLDMALDLYFRHFHPLIPFVHVPTFSAKRTRLPLLFVMCQIGMIILGTKGTTNFVLKTFAFSLDRITADMAECAANNESPVGIISTFAAALLVLNLATMTGEKFHLQQSQMLYINLMSIAQRNGLFNADEDHSVGMPLFETIPDVEMRWKAWCRVESSKRLILGLLILDSWFSSVLSVSPISSPCSVQFVVPCRESLFQADSSFQWLQYIREGDRIITPMIKSPSETDIFPVLDQLAHELSMHGMLAMLQLRLSEAYHRLLSKKPTYPFIPCETYAMDEGARCLARLQAQLMDTYSEPLQRMNPNCIIMWHRMCMDLSADIQLFDLAAGRNGAEPALKALDDIQTWSRTPAARRACLHAAHIFKALSNRKASEDIMFYSTHALFSAALVLGLYVYMVPLLTETQPGAVSIELLDDVDWQQIGMEGFTSFVEPEESKLPSLTNNQAINFIRNGGTICLRGVPHRGGYQSARRILLDYGGLLKDTGKWSVRKMSYVLHIMSDVLMDAD